MRQRLVDWSRRLPGACLRALLPSCCALCGMLCEGVLCAPCQYRYVQTRRRCRQCANPLPAHEPVARCAGCLRLRPAFDATVAALDYAAPLDALALQLKFSARLALAPLCARLLRDALLAQGEAALPAVLCPVPLGPRRLVGRGYNQALEIARPLARSLGIALAPRLLVRRSDTAAQSRLTPRARRRNVRGAFVVEGDVAGLHVGVIDDVMTSGNTLNEIARVLKRAGAARVTNLVFARTPPKS